MSIFNLLLLFGLLGCSSKKGIVDTLDMNPSMIKGDGYEAILIPKRTFTMGCISEQSNCGDDPVRQVTISNDFYMMKSEVTQGGYQNVMGSNPSKFKDCGKDCPVEMVNWYDAVKFANALSKKEDLEQCYQIGTYSENEYGREMTAVSWSKGVNCTGWRLPTEAEWEYAARGGENYKYSGSNNIDEVAWYNKNSNNETHSVCSKKVNGFGICDMSGNVFEWVWDLYEEYSSGSSEDPTGSTTGSSRAFRGGGWRKGAGRARVSFRFKTDRPFERDSLKGFRLVRTVH